MITTYNIVNQEGTEEYISKYSIKPYTKLLISYSGIYATYGILDLCKDKLNVVAIDVADDNLRFRGLTPLVQIFTCKRWDIEGSVTFKFITAEGLGIHVTLSDIASIRKLCAYADKINAKPTYKDWLKSQRNSCVK